MANVEKISSPSTPASKDDQSSTDECRFSGTIQVPVDQICVRDRYRKSFGDVERLARSIDEVGLLQPIVITRDHQLVAGERRLRAVRDVLKHELIEAKIVDLTWIIDGEYAENAFRKDFTISERVSIAAKIAEDIGNRRGSRSDLKGDQQMADSPEVIRPHETTRDAAARLAKFSSTTIYREAKKVVDKGVDRLTRWMDEEKLSISTCAVLASLPTEKQEEAVAGNPKSALDYATAIRRRVRKLEDFDAGIGNRPLWPEHFEEEREALKELPVQSYHQQLRQRIDKLVKLASAISQGNLGHEFDWIIDRRTSLNSYSRRQLGFVCQNAAEKLLAVAVAVVSDDSPSSERIVMNELCTFGRRTI